MHGAEGFIAVDWGTTNRRAYLLDSGRKCSAEFEDGKGILSVPRGGFPDAVAEIRDRLGDHRLLLAGMVGSNRGWVEAPYVHCPAGIEDVARALVWPTKREAIVPGVAYLEGDRADVMRGEEVQLLGAVAAGLIPPDCLVCHPGTHNKWVEMRGGRIASFRTVVTGELFNLLKEHSILSDLLAAPVGTGAAFEAGVQRGLHSDALAADLFSIRARVLLGASAAADAASFTSGLLIGGDIRIGLRSAPEGPIAVMARPELTVLYASALETAGREAFEVDGETCFLAGTCRIAESIP